MISLQRYLFDSFFNEVVEPKPSPSGQQSRLLKLQIGQSLWAFVPCSSYFVEYFNIFHIMSHSPRHLIISTSFYIQSNCSVKVQFTYILAQLQISGSSAGDPAQSARSIRTFATASNSGTTTWTLPRTTSTVRSTEPKEGDQGGNIKQLNLFSFRMESDGVVG